MALYPEYRNIHCNCVNPEDGILDDGVFPFYSIRPVCGGPLSFANRAPCVMSNYSGGNTWRPYAASSLPLTTCTMAGDILLLATMTVTSHDPEGITVEIEDHEGTWLATYKNMVQWQPHCDVAMKLVDYETSYTCAIPWRPYATLQPAPGGTTTCGSGFDYVRGGYSLTISGVDSSDPNYEVVQALADLGAISGTMWSGSGAAHAFSYMVGDEIWVCFLKLSFIRLVGGLIVVTFRVTLHAAGNVSEVGAEAGGLWAPNLPSYQSGGALAASQDAGTIGPDDPIPCWPAGISNSGAASFWSTSGGGAIDCNANVVVSFTTQSSVGDMVDCNPGGAGPGDPCQGSSVWTLHRTDCGNDTHLYYWILQDKNCQGRCIVSQCKARWPFDVPSVPITEEEADDAGFLDLVDTAIEGDCDCGTSEPTEAPPCPCWGTSTWTLRRSLCSTDQYLYYWEPTSDTCGGECDSSSCVPRVPYNLSATPVTAAEATALGYDDDLNQEIAGQECFCGAAYSAPSCPECDCSVAATTKTLTISGPGEPADGTYTIVKGGCETGDCCWRGVEEDTQVAAELSFSSGTWTLVFDGGATYTASGYACDNPIVLSGSPGGGWPTSVTVTDV